MRVETIGDATLYLGDCLEILPMLGKVDAVVTDPPYGINAARDRHSEQWGWKDYPAGGWDKERPTREVFDCLNYAAPIVVIWGGNYFADLLPAKGKWLIWDKGQTDFSLADAELAWTSLDGATRRIVYPRARAMQDGKEHPTQKALRVMEWTIDQAASDAQTILDPFMGSGTTGVACANLGRRFIGIEIEPKYFDIACRRIADAYKQPRLFEDEKIPPKPLDLF
jgi:DNA modification methylase